MEGRTQAEGKEGMDGAKIVEGGWYLRGGENKGVGLKQRVSGEPF